jgi:uroporphyrinogen decarboxylase
MTKHISSLERVLTTLQHKEPDRVPLFLLLTMHGAKELNMGIQEYFAKPENVVKGQMILKKKYNNDLFYPFYYASIEVEAYGGQVIFSENGPPNAGKPMINNFNDILKMKPIDMEKTSCLSKVFNTISQLKKVAKDEIPIVGVVMSPFSVPVMQMGFDKYIELVFEDRDKFNYLMEFNKEFCINYANKQLESGATAICYFDPLSNQSIFPKDLLLKTGFKIAKETISKINGPTAMHLASGITLPDLHHIIDTGTKIVGVSTFDDLKQVKDICKDKITILGNMNGIEMINWSLEECEEKVKNIMKIAGNDGGFILSDNHGEIPFQVSDEILLKISHTVQKWGKYPLNY